MPAPIGASVPQGSISRPVLWNIYKDDLLRQLPAVMAYADDCIFVVSFCRQDNRRAVAAANRHLKVAEDNTHTKVVSQSPSSTEKVERQVRFGNVQLPLQDNIKVALVTVGRELLYDVHITYIARQTS